MSGKNAGLVSVGCYVPGKVVDPRKKAKLVEFLRGTLLPPEYIKEIEETGKMPGYVETNYDGWESQPWFEEWLNRMPKWKRERDPWSGAKQRTRVPHDPESVRKSLVPMPMKSTDAETFAGAMAIMNAGMNKDDIDLVITASQTPDVTVPPNCSLTQHKLGLKTAGAYCVDTCCSSFGTCLEVATSLVRLGIKKNVLIINSHIGQLAMDRSTYYSVALGDAAGAGIVSAVDPPYGYIASHSTSHGQYHDAFVITRRRPEMLTVAEQMPSFEHDLLYFSNPVSAKEIGHRALEHFQDAVDGVLEKAGMTIDDVNVYTGHQPVGWCIPKFAEKIGIAEGHYYNSFETLANTGMASVPLNIEGMIESRMCKAGDVLLLASPGAGHNHVAVLERLSPQVIQSVHWEDNDQPYTHSFA